MLVVSNTSPLSNLAIIGRLDLVREQFGKIVVPPAVEAELKRNPIPAARTRLDGAFASEWLRVQRLTLPVPGAVQRDLHRGEAEAIALALELKAERVLLDEADARLRAKEFGLAHTGALGVLQKARQGGRLV